MLHSANIILRYSKSKVSVTADIVRISTGCLWNILHEICGMKKLLCVRWVPRSPTEENQIRERRSKKFWRTLNGNQTPKLRGSKMWVQQPKTQFSVGKVVASILYSMYS